MPIALGGDASWSLMDRNDRLRLARINAGFETATDAAHALGVKATTYTGHENGHRGFDDSDAQLYARRFGVRLLWLLTGEKPMKDGPLGIVSSIKQPRRVKRTVDDGNGSRQSDDRLAGWPPDSQIVVLEADVRAGMGGGGVSAEPFVRTENGITIADEMPSAEWAIPASYLVGHLRIRPGTAFIFEVYGDSMYDPGHPGAPGSLYPGDKVIADTQDVRPSPSGPFVLWDGVGIVVKLVELVRGSTPAKLRLKSRNPSYGDYEATEDEARIIGRVRGKISAM